MRYRKKPVEIDAILVSDVLDGAVVLPLWLSQAISSGHVAVRTGKRELKILTPEGNMVANERDWILRGIKGELYPCKPDIFAATYEPARRG